MLIFTALVALQLRFVQLRTLGVVISLLSVPLLFVIMMISAFTSESKNGYLAIHENELFRFCKTVFLLSLLNLLVLMVCSH